MWGKCYPTDCDWAVENNPEGSATTTVNDAGDGVLNIVWDHGFAVRTQEITYLEGDRLEVYTYTDYKRTLEKILENMITLKKVFNYLFIIAKTI